MRLALTLRATDLIMLQVDVFWYALEESESECRVQADKTEHYLQTTI